MNCEIPCSPVQGPEECVGTPSWSDIVKRSTKMGVAGPKKGPMDRKTMTGHVTKVTKSGHGHSCINNHSLMTRTEVLAP